MKKLILISNLLLFSVLSFGQNQTNLFTFQRTCGFVSDASCTTCTGGYSAAYVDGITIYNRNKVYVHLQQGWTAKQKGNAIEFTSIEGKKYTILRTSTVYATMAAYRAAIEAMCSGGGGVVSITGAGINTVTGTHPNFTVTGTEADGDVSNEGVLSVGAASPTSAFILSNTSGSSQIELASGVGIQIIDSGVNTIFIEATTTGIGTYAGGTSSQANALAIAGGSILGQEYLWDDGFALHRMTVR